MSALPARGGGLEPAALEAPWRRCLELAWEAFRAGTLPIGAVIVAPGGRIVAEGRNRIRGGGEAPGLWDSRLAHAEVNALLAFEARGEPDRQACTIYSTTEPCALCMGAIRLFSLAEVRFAARDPFGGSACMAERVPFLKARGLRVEGPLEPELEAALSALLLEALSWRLPPEHPIFAAFAAAQPRAARLRAALAAEGATGRWVAEGWDAGAVFAELGRRLSA